MIPNNEFSEQFTADFPSADMMWHYWLQPKYDKARTEWEKTIIQKTEHIDRKVNGQR